MKYLPASQREKMESLDLMKNSKKTIMHPTIKKIEIEPGYYVMTYFYCIKTCYGANKFGDKYLYKCPNFGTNGNCKICPKKCKWDCQKNKDYELIVTMEDKTIYISVEKNISKKIKKNWII